METPENGKHEVFCFHQTGQHHMDEGKDCEDVSVIVTRANYCFYGLADGQSGKRYCREGGRAVLMAVSDFLEQKGIHNLCQYEFLDEVQYELIKVIRETLSTLGKSYGTDSLLDFSSTLVVFAMDPHAKEYITVHIGDGAIIAVSKDNTLEVVSGPENGVIDKYTWLTTSRDAMYHIRIRRECINTIRRIAMVTDGATMLIRGRAIAKNAESLLIEGTVKDFESEIFSAHPQDDASCILVVLE